MWLGTVGISKRDALGDQPARTRRTRGGDEIGRALDAKAGIALARSRHLCRIKELRQIGQLMDDDVRTGVGYGSPHSAGIEGIEHDRRDP